MKIKVHKLKIAPKYFSAVISDQKRAELRKDDRGFKTGDLLHLCEWQHGKFTGREQITAITHVLALSELNPNLESWAMLSIRPMNALEAMVYIATGAEL